MKQLCLMLVSLALLCGCESRMFQMRVAPEPDDRAMIAASNEMETGYRNVQQENELDDLKIEWVGITYGYDSVIYDRYKLCVKFPPKVPKNQAACQKLESRIENEKKDHQAKHPW